MLNEQQNNLETNVSNEPLAKITIIGVGGGGNNSVDSMIKAKIDGVKFLMANTDLQVLNKYDQDIVIHLGNSAGNRGLGAGANPEVGRQAALETVEEIKTRIQGSDMVIVTAGMGGGTGTGAAPIIAQVAKDMGILTIGIVTTPFAFEGPKRSNNSTDGIEQMKTAVDSLIVISNNKLLEQFGNIPITDSFKYADTILKQTVKTMTDIISVPALVNLDFADVTTVVKDKGLAIIGIGKGSGKDKAVKAAHAAINSPILESSILGAKDLIVNVTGGAKDFSLQDANIVVETIKDAVGGNPNVIFGVAVDNNKDSNDIYVSIIATGLSGKQSSQLEDEEWQEVHENMTEIFTSELDIEEVELQYSRDEEYPEEDLDDDLPPYLKK
ncbi:cell division protein FtsZ [Mycoplasma iguanae]|uniref:Cell division protein FtsZ n=1 Tax=Mycoplasma iguanae TaxID=292461 RepID=A0ABY5RB38_9MOLU|nr:cell division protein FtsZ [Mycoplasma iguanae]UVD81967.1 cell division protein FtsZ [Mycoplasma iguanae]